MDPIVIVLLKLL